MTSAKKYATTINGQSIEELYSLVAAKFGEDFSAYSPDFMKCGANGDVSPDVEEDVHPSEFMSVVLQGGNKHRYPLPGRILGAFYRYGIMASMGKMPTYEHVFTMYLTSDMCDLLLAHTEVYEAVTDTEHAIAWDVKTNAYNVTSGRFHTKPFPHIKPGEKREGISTCAAGLSGVPLGDRVTLIIAAKSGTVSAEIGFGSLRIAATDDRYTHIAISVPSCHLSKVIIHSNGLAAVTGFFKTGSLERNMGKLENHPAINKVLPLMMASHTIAPTTDAIRLAVGAPVYRATLVKNFQSVFEFNDVQYLQYGSVTVISTQPLSFNLLVPADRGYDFTTFAVISSTADAEGQVAVYPALCDARIVQGISTGVTFDDFKSSLSHKIQTYADVFKHRRDSMIVHTYDKNVRSSFMAQPYGKFNPVALTDDYMQGMFKSEMPGMSKL